MNNRIEKKFLDLKNQQPAKCAFIAYLCAGDPNFDDSLNHLITLSKNNVDLIEVGVPFLDPAGDGPTIEMASKRAIKNGMDLSKTLKLIAEFRKFDNQTPIILMTYFNPILKYGLNKIFIDSKQSGVDGFLIVDLPFEEENAIIESIKINQLDLIRLIAPTTSQSRMQKILKNASGFVYLITMLGITGTKTAKIEDNLEIFSTLKTQTNLPIVAGFGIKNSTQILEFKKLGFDGIVIGSEIIKEIDLTKTSQQISQNIEKKVAEFAKAIKS